MNAILAVVIMAVMAFLGILAGAFLNDPMGGAILFALISGIGCIIYTIHKKEN